MTRGIRGYAAGMLVPSGWQANARRCCFYCDKLGVEFRLAHFPLGIIAPAPSQFTLQHRMGKEYTMACAGPEFLALKAACARTLRRIYVYELNVDTCFLCLPYACFRLYIPYMRSLTPQ